MLGGYGNTACGLRSIVGGGFCNTASGLHSIVGGGFCNTASYYATTVSGGFRNTASGGYSFVGGGTNNTASVNYSFVGGGAFNTACGNYSAVLGGYGNTVSGYYSGAFGYGLTNVHDCSFMANRFFADNLSSFVGFGLEIGAGGEIIPFFSDGRLKTNPDSRRLMVNAWNVGALESMVLPPCHYGFQVYKEDISTKNVDD